MPKLKFSMPGDHRYNTLMSVVALLQREEEIHLNDLAKHFDVQPKMMRSMLATLNKTSFMPRNSEEQLPYFIDLDRVDDEEDGMVCLSLDEGPQGVPQLTGPQAAAILSGLSYLRSIPEFSESAEIEELIELLSANQKNISEVAFQLNDVDGDLKVLQSAILTNHRISCLYVNSRGEESVREIDPLLLVSEESLWYLRGYCLKNRAIRTFRLDHMVEAKQLDVERGEEALNAAKSLDETAPIYNPSSTDTEVELELSPEAYKLAALSKNLEEPKKGSSEIIRATIKLGFLPDLGPLVTRFGNHAKVIAPKEAREVVRKFAESALSTHSEEDSAE
jgi:proteasome accessory factor C